MIRGGFKRIMMKITMVSSEITMETFDKSSIMKKFMQYAAYPMLVISFEDNKRIMLVT